MDNNGTRRIRKIALWLAMAVASTLVGMIVNEIVTRKSNVRLEFSGAAVQGAVGVNIFNGKKELKNVYIKGWLIPVWEQQKNKYVQSKVTLAPQSRFDGMDCTYSIDSKTATIEAKCPFINPREFVTIELCYIGKADGFRVIIRAEGFDHGETYDIYN